MSRSIIILIFSLLIIGCNQKSTDYQAGYENGYVDGSQNSFSFIVDVDGNGHWGTKSDTIYLSNYCEPGVWDVGFVFDRVGISYDPFDSAYVLQYVSKDSTRYIQRKIPQDSIDSIYWRVISIQNLGK